jgi:predicted nuclease of predicted toxin-antitoxin system
MRILIDECLDWRLCRALSGHDCVSVQKQGWGGLTNSALLRKAEQDFDVFITGDRNLVFQQQLSDLDIAVLVLHAESMQCVTRSNS